tara:strand:- start:160 stop:429 length:270 start_codon:yes stop_codon:yes gene_type:complete
MKLKLQIWETLVTERLHELEIDSSNYPELKDKSKDEIQKYIDDNMWEMNPPDENSAYESLGEELCEADFIGEETPAPEFSDVEIINNDE